MMSDLDALVCCEFCDEQAATVRAGFRFLPDVLAVYYLCDDCVAELTKEEWSEQV